MATEQAAEAGEAVAAPGQDHAALFDAHRTRRDLFGQAHADQLVLAGVLAREDVLEVVEHLRELLGVAVEVCLGHVQAGQFGHLRDVGPSDMNGHKGRGYGPRASVSLLRPDPARPGANPRQ